MFPFIAVSAVTYIAAFILAPPVDIDGIREPVAGSLSYGNNTVTDMQTTIFFILSYVIYRHLTTSTWTAVGHFSRALSKGVQDAQGYFTRQVLIGYRRGYLAGAVGSIHLIRDYSTVHISSIHSTSFHSRSY